MVRSVGFLHSKIESRGYRSAREHGEKCWILRFFLCASVPFCVSVLEIANTSLQKEMVQ